MRIASERGGLPPGQAVMTSGGRLGCRHVIHTVGPIWRGGSFRESDLLSSCYRQSLALAASHHLTSVAFPSISTGAYSYPVAEAARVALTTVREVLLAGLGVELVRFVLFTKVDLGVYEAALSALPD